MNMIPLNTANILTLGRIALIPPLVWLVVSPQPWTTWPGLILYAMIALTDWLDGYVARRCNQTSEFGRFLDPIADKILVAAMFIALTSNGTLNGWLLSLPLVILTREFLVSGLREFLGPKDVIVAVTPLAKWKTTVQMLALGCLIPAKLYIDAAIGGNLLLLAATVLTLVTGWQYLKAALPHLKG